MFTDFEVSRQNIETGAVFLQNLKIRIFDVYQNIFVTFYVCIRTANQFDKQIDKEIERKRYNKYRSKPYICKPEHTCKVYTQYIICNLTTLVQICITIQLNTLIIFTCTIKLKIYISWNKTLIDYRIRVIHPHIADKMDLSCIGINRYRLGNTKSIVSGLIHNKLLH